MYDFLREFVKYFIIFYIFTMAVQLIALGFIGLFIGA
jgi:hypothetical protein